MTRIDLGLLIGIALTLQACTFHSKARTERMAAVVSEVRDRYRADADISHDDQIFDAYDYFVKAKDYGNAAPSPCSTSPKSFWPWASATRWNTTRR